MSGATCKNYRAHSYVAPSTLLPINVGRPLAVSLSLCLSLPLSPSRPLYAFPYFTTHARSLSCLSPAYTFSSLLSTILFLSMPFFSLPSFIKLLLRLTFILFSALIFAHALSSHPIYSCVAFLLPNIPSGIIWLK